MTGVEEHRAMRQLFRPIAALRRAPPFAGQQIDIAFAREIEAVTVATGERARLGGEIEPADRTA
jgi:hypothetical protein